MSTSSHSHSDVCPVTGASGSNPHVFCPPQPGDSRAPCPALNTLANHGYLPRDGKRINAKIIIAAVRAGFHLSLPLAWVLTRGALALLNQGGDTFCLHDLARHGRVEHPASLFHRDPTEREEYAPIEMCEELLEEMFNDSSDGVLLRPEDVARARVRRELSYPKSMDFIHAELARGEMAIVLNLFNNPNAEYAAAAAAGFKDEKPRSALAKLKARFFSRREEKTDATGAPLAGPPIDVLRDWITHERLPKDWAPYHTVSLWETVVMTTRVRSTMRKLAKEARSGKVVLKEAVANVEEKQISASPVAEEDEAAKSPVEEMTKTGRPHRLPLMVHSRSPTGSSMSNESEGPRTPIDFGGLVIPEMVLPSMPRKINVMGAELPHSDKGIIHDAIHDMIPTVVVVEGDE